MINFNNHNIKQMSYNNHMIKRAYGCDARLVWQKSEDYADMYFTIIPSRTTCISKNGGAYQYSLDSGNTWVNADSGTSISVQQYKPVMFKGTEAPLTTKGIGTFHIATCGGSIIGDCKFEAMGNIMSLLYGDNFRGQTSLVGKDYAFSNLFNDTYITSAENLVLPATTLSRGCYSEMFSSCYHLTKAPKTISATTLAPFCCYYMFRNCKRLAEAPDLLAPTLVDRCYVLMFIGCNSLNKIVCAATNPTENNTWAWVQSVASAGTFYKHKDATWTTGNNGIPEGWVVKDYEPPFDGKWKATYRDGSTSIAECDASSAITNGEIVKANLVSVEIGDCVTSIGDYSFDGCTGLTSVRIPNSVTSIGKYAFQHCTSLPSVTIPDSVISIGIYTFGNCDSLTNVTIPNSVTSIGQFAFAECSGLTSCTIGSGITKISNGLFHDCSSLSSITITDSITTIGQYAFDGCSGLTSVIIPDSVTRIESSAFSGCTSLTSCTIGSGVKVLLSGAFYGCSSLTSITVLPTTPPNTYDSNNMFVNTNDCPIYVPAESVNIYKKASAWSSYASRIQPIP